MLETNQTSYHSITRVLRYAGVALTHYYHYSSEIYGICSYGVIMHTYTLLFPILIYMHTKRPTNDNGEA